MELLSSKEEGDFQIRRTAAADVPSLLQLICGLAEYEKLSHAVTGSEELLRENGFGKNSYYHSLLAEAAGRAVGFALYFYTFSTFTCKPTLYLEDLFVLPEHRGQGIGKALLVRLAVEARKRNCGRMEWSVLDWNRPAIDFYRRLGASPQSDWTVFRLEEEQIARLAGKKI